MTQIEKAILFATQAHLGQPRKWGNEPYICHPLRVFLDGVAYGLSETEKLACILHDVIEDTTKTYDDILKEFGKDVADLVQELTNPSKALPSQSPRTIKKEMDFEHLKKCSTSAKRIKMLDRIDNLSGNVNWNFMKKYLPESRELMNICKSTDERLANKFRLCLEMRERQLEHYRLENNASGANNETLVR